MPGPGLSRLSIVLAFLAAGAVARAATPTFHAPFDTGTAAATATGSPVGMPSAELTLGDGIAGKAVTIGVTEDTEFLCKYEAAGNVSIEQGTVSLWVKPLDWNGTDPHFQVFFSAMGESSVLHIYRYQDVGAQSPNSRKLLFLFGPAKRNAEGNWEWTIASSARAREWDAGQWHHMACSWDAENLTLYLDGRIEDTKQIRVRPATEFSTFGVGGLGSWDRAGGTSLVDELKIYSAPLTSAEVYTEWEEHRPGREETPPTEEEPSFGLDYLYTNIEAGTLNLGLRQPYPLWSGRAITARVRLLGEDAKTVLERSFSEAEYSYEASLDISELPPGAYQIDVLFQGTGELALGRFQDSYTKYPPGPAPWEGNGIGISDDVPAPWTALEVSDGVARCWGREYRFGDSALPTQIASQGIELLHSPVSMSGVLNDTRVELRTNAMTWEQTSGAAAVFSADSAIGPVEVRSSGRIEYDGFAWLDIILDPPTPTEVSRLVLDIPLRKEAASLRNLGHYRLENTGAAPQTGRYFRNLEERPIFWLGNEEAGLQWCAESLRGWCVKDFAHTLEVVAEEDRVVARLNIIDTATVLREPTRISFGLQATPVRPKPQAWRRWRLRPWRGPRPTYNIRPWFTEWTELFNYPKLSHVVESKTAERQRCEEDGAQVLSYVSLSCTTPYSPEYKYYGELWRQVPQPRVLVHSALDPQTRIWAHNTICARSSSYRDFYLWMLRKAVHELQLTGGLYFDQAVPQLCANELHGCQWLDANGGTHRTFNVLGTRELAKRIYVMMKGYSPDSLIAHHMSGEVTMPVNSFSDMMIDGENLTGKVGLAGNYYDALPLDTFRAEYMPHQWGTIPALLPQHARAASILKTREEELYWYTSPEAKKPIDHLLGLVLVHDAMIWPAWEVRPNALWEAQDAFGWDEDITFLPYWDNDEYVKVLAPETENVVVSVFRRPGRIMLVPLNNTDDDVIVKISLALGKLGLAERGQMRLLDTYHGGEFTIRDGVAEAPVPARGFRMLVTSG